MKKKAHDKSIREVILARKNKIMLRRDYCRLLVHILLSAAVIWLLLAQVFIVMMCSGNEMFPALMDGDLLIGYRLPEKYSRNDTVIYTQNGIKKAGRIAACRGDVVDFDESGALRVNGTLQTGQAFYPSFPKEQYSYPMRIEEDCVFILGDCRTRSTDSRDFGPRPLEALDGKVITLLRRRKI